jgi:hypothetical protein
MNVICVGDNTNTGAGAFAYNLFHHRGIALLITGAGFVLHQEWLIALGILLFAHSSFDQMLGFGLKYNRGFEHTHLGWAEKEEPI